MTLAPHKLETESHPAVIQWKELCADPALANLPYKIETTRSGKLIMSPGSYSHGSYQVKLAVLLTKSLPSGNVSVESAILTNDGIKVADITWMSQERCQVYRSVACLPFAPDLCVEVDSPSNTRRERQEKQRLYFEAGAQEVWFCDKHGVMSFYSQGDKKAMPRSVLCPDFPLKIEW